MAEFCYHCAKKLGEQNTLQHQKPFTKYMSGIFKGNAHSLHYDVCEGCGPGWFDHYGIMLFDADGKPVKEQK